MQRRVAHQANQDVRRARTRQLIELGGLVKKAGLVELTRDDRNTLLGGLLMLAELLQSQRRTASLPILQRKGRRAFRGDMESSSGDADAPW
ncbi:conjugal transfer protein TraD [Brevundimonas aurantiaca]|uniref:Conjugal transfer protein TraD n=1 Tax=Brevundimonas aurantiaca TaxID=74316 RepID=A0A7W9C9E1_9CAUL|nr:conjugal transfer protein TraD [Brevundimonas aurantiaca]MBB5741495.1 hypothetical protein [Brevundimonas aurantiaca]